MNELEYQYPDIAHEVFSQRLRDIAKQAASDALAEASLTAILDEVLPGLTGGVRRQILEAGEYMVDRGVSHVSIVHPVEARWEDEPSPDAMTATFG